MKQPPKNHMRLDQTRQVIARLAAFLAFAFHLADLKTAADDVREVDSTHDQLPSGVAGRYINPVLAPHVLDRLGFDQ